MKSKLVPVLAFGLLAILLGLIASDYPAGRMGGLPIRDLLIFALLLVPILFERYWRARKAPADFSGRPTSRTPVKDYSRLKPLYLALAVVSAASYYFIPQSNWFSLSVMVGACLLATFFTPEKIEDERIEHLKLKAIRAAFATAFFLVFLLTGLFRGKERPDHFLSAFDMIILTMLIALGFFHYWRWQDGRAARDS